MELYYYISIYMYNLQFYYNIQNTLSSWDVEKKRSVLGLKQNMFQCMYGSARIKLNSVPADIPLAPFNQTLDRKDYIPRKVVLRIKDYKIKMDINFEIFIQNSVHFILLKP